MFFAVAVLFLNEWVQGAKRRWIARKKKTHKPQNQKGFSEEQKGGAQAMKSERRLSEAFGAVCAYALRAIERSAVGGLPKRGAAAHINARHLIKKHEATS